MPILEGELVGVGAGPVSACVDLLLGGVLLGFFLVANPESLSVSFPARTSMRQDFTSFSA